MTEPDAKALPLDSPLARPTRRVYAALTNHCNRDCPWCSTCSSPRGTTWLSLERLRAALPPSDECPHYELQLEGGEPLLHTEFDSFVAFAGSDPRCTKLVVCTNGTTLPRDTPRLQRWLHALGQTSLVKLSFNHHLLARDPGLPGLARRLIDLAEVTGVDVVINVRLRRGDDDAVLDAARRHNLLNHANVFFLQRYGFAADEADWAAPHVVSNRFTLINPDGTVFTDLVERSQAMRDLP